MRKICLLVLFAATAAWAQLHSNTITVTALRSVTATPNSAAFTVSVYAPVDSSFDEVLALLQPAGIDASQLTGVYQSNFGDASALFAWTFTLQVPLARLSDTLKALSTIQSQSGTATVSFAVSAARSNTVAQDFLQCPMPALLADATTQAQQFASLAGVTLGPVLALSDSANSGDSGQGYAAFLSVPAFINVSGFLIGGISSFPYATTNTCSLTVEYGVVRYQ